jgi:hypothetical protein
VNGCNFNHLSASLFPDYECFQLFSSDDDKPTQHFQKDFAPLYRLLRTTGAEVYADVPTYYEIDGTGTGDLETYLIGMMSLPILPTERLVVGESWQAAIDLTVGSIGSIRRSGSAANRIPARGTFEAVEWERGQPCAKLRYELEQGVGNRTSKELELAGREFKDNDRLRIEQLVWVSLSTGKLVRQDMIMEADTKVAVGDSGGGGGMGVGGGGRGGPAPVGGGGGRGGPAPVGGGRGGQSVGDIRVQVPAGGRGGQGGGFGVPGGNQGGGDGGGSVFLRQKLYLKMVLE